MRRSVRLPQQRWVRGGAWAFAVLCNIGCGKATSAGRAASIAETPPTAADADLPTSAPLADPVTQTGVRGQTGAIDRGRAQVPFRDDAALLGHGPLGAQLLRLRVAPPNAGQREALEAAGVAGAAALGDALWHDDARVRSGAARLLGAVELTGTEMSTALLRSLRQEPDRDVRALVAFAVVGRRAPSAAATLAEVLAGDEAGGVREAAAWALGTAATETEARDAAGAALQTALADRDATVRLAAVASLRRLRARDRLAALQAMRGDADPRVRRAALAAVEDLSGSKRAERERGER